MKKALVKEHCQSTEMATYKQKIIAQPFNFHNINIQSAEKTNYNWKRKKETTKFKVGIELKLAYVHRKHTCGVWNMLCILIALAIM